jgi:DNA-binding response OmpR family regulator
MQIGVEAQRAVDNRRVFVIESDEIRRTALQFMLADENETHEFAAPDAALGMTGRAPDIVLLGADLLHARGSALLARLRSAWKGTRLIVVCDARQAAGAQAVQAAGADDTLAYPFDMAAIRRKVDHWLGRRPALRVAVVTR